MSKREKIILILTLVAALYGLVDFFVLTPRKKNREAEQVTSSTNETLVNFITDSMDKITRIELQTKQLNRQYLILKIESNWENDPFVQPLEQKPEQKKTSVFLDVPNVTYSGYVIAGKRALAIINGYEYGAGEIINGYDYRVINIIPQKVVLGNNRGRVDIFFNEE